MRFLAGFFGMISLALANWVRQRERAWRRCYRYAVDHADTTEAGAAYNDMATVIVLDGKVTPTHGDRGNRASGLDAAS